MSDKLSRTQEWTLRTIYEESGWGERPYRGALLSDLPYIRMQTFRILLKRNLIFAEHGIWFSLTDEGRAVAELLPARMRDRYYG